MAKNKKTPVKSTVRKSDAAKSKTKAQAGSLVKKTAVRKASAKAVAAKSAVKKESKVASKSVAKSSAGKTAKPAKAAKAPTLSSKAAAKPSAKSVSKSEKRLKVATPVSKPEKTDPAKFNNDNAAMKRVPPKMKKMVVKPAQPQTDEDLYENNAKDFAFAFAESIKKECEVAEARKSADAAKNAVRLTKRPTSRAKGSATLKFSGADLAQFRKTLLALRQSIVGKTATLKTNALEQTIDRAGEDEDGSDSFMRLQNLGQVGEQNKILQKIDEALHRIEDGSYGICEVCGQLIRKARLQHLPFAHTCMECQSAMELNSASSV